MDLQGLLEQGRLRWRDVLRSGICIVSHGSLQSMEEVVLSTDDELAVPGIVVMLDRAREV